MGVVETFGLAGIIVFAGFSGNLFFKKTGIPDILLLFFLGSLIGPIFKFVDPSSLESITPVFSALAIMILLFDGGLRLNIYTVIEQSPRATLLASIGVALSIALTAGFTYVFMGWSLLNGLLLGAIIGGSSSSIVVPLVNRIRVDERITALLSIESSFTDAMTIVLGIAILNVLVLGPVGGAGPSSVARDIASAFSIGGVLGFMGGIVWLRVLRSLKGETYDDILTLCAVLVIYAGSESVGGNGAISALLFGLVLGNGTRIASMLRMKESVEAGEIMKKFQAQISFLIRTFFFVYLGIVVTISNPTLVFLGLILSLLMFVGRYISVSLSSIGSPLLKENGTIITYMLPRGLAAAILSQLPIIYGIPDAQLFPDVIFTVIIFTVVICTLGVYLPRLQSGRSQSFDLPNPL